MLDLNALWAVIQPYITAAGGSTAVITLIITCVKAYSAIKSAANAQKLAANANAKPAEIISAAIQQSIPQTLNIKIDEIVEPYLRKLTKDVLSKLDKEVIDEISTLTQKVDLTLQALRCLKSVSDTVKDEISNAISEKPEENILTVSLVGATTTAKDAEVKAVEGAVELPPVE